MLFVGNTESPARDVTLLTGGFNRRMRNATEPKSPARDDTSHYLMWDENNLFISAKPNVSPLAGLLLWMGAMLPGVKTPG
jgi:hypothetical protein